MDNYGFVKVAAAIPFGKVADLEYNAEQIVKQTCEANEKGASVIVFPELAITSYTCGDLFYNTSLLSKSLDSLIKITNATAHCELLALIGIPVIYRNNLYNCAAVINKGRILGIVPKTYIPNYREFYEIRWFTSAGDMENDTVIIGGEEIPFGKKLLFRNSFNPNFIVGAEICEDFWHPLPPSTIQAQNGATVLCNLSASNSLIAKNDFRTLLIKSQSAKAIAAYVYCSTGMGESTTDVVFDACGMIYENGAELAASERFLRENQIIYGDVDIEKITYERTKLNSFSGRQDNFDLIQFEASQKSAPIERHFAPHPFVPSKKEKLDERCREIFYIQSSALAKRLETIKGTKAVIGLSGGLDSTLALLVTIKAFDLIDKPREDIIGITMPGFGTTRRTYNSVDKLCKALDLKLRESDIKDISKLMFKKLDHSQDQHDTVYENVQARARTYLLMSEANKHGGIVIGTGDLSEIALGWCTYNGDHISMYNVNCSIPKTLVKFLIRWVADREVDEKTGAILHEILEHPISPELLPTDGEEITQITEDKIGPYELVDFFLYNFVRFGFSYRKIHFMACRAFHKKYSSAEIKKWLTLFYKRFFHSQWKRDCVPAGPKVGNIDLSPRGSWRMPSEAELTSFLEEVD